MNGLREAEHLYDGRLPEAYLVADIEDIEFDSDRAVTDLDVEDFIVKLVDSKDPVAFLENEANQHLYEIGDFDLHIAVAHQWVSNKELVAPAIGRVFWQWAKACAFEISA